MNPRLFIVGLALGLIAMPIPLEGQRAEEIEALVRSLDLNRSVDLEPECPDPPAGAEPIVVAAVFRNQPPIFRDSTGYPADFCPANTTFYARADGAGRSTTLGDIVWWERYCAQPGFRLVADGRFETAAGDTLRWDAVIRTDSVPPPIPNATFSGEFTFKPGTGRFASATGSANVAAAQLGDAPPGRPAGSTAVVVCGWVGSSRR